MHLMFLRKLMELLYEEYLLLHIYSSIFAYVPRYGGAYTVNEKGGGDGYEN